MSSDNFNTALHSVSSTLQTQQEQRAYLCLLSRISYYINEVRDISYWKDFVEAIDYMGKKNFAEEADA